MARDDRKRPRTSRRESERAARKLVHDKQRLAQMSPGGAPDRPILVEASPVVLVRARSTPCPLCGGELSILDERAPNATLREVQARCRMCGVARSLWFRIGTPLPS